MYPKRDDHNWSARKERQSFVELERSRKRAPELNTASQKATKATKGAGSSPLPAITFCS
jgi:hypothetical protein